MPQTPHRLLLALWSAACLAGTASADFAADFDGLAAGEGPGGAWIVDGTVEAAAAGGGEALRLRSEGNDSSATARRPVEMVAGEEAWTASVDWCPGSWSKPGVVLELTQPNANQRLFRITTLSGKNTFRATDWPGGEETDTPIGEDYKKDHWYRVTATGTLGEPEYAVRIVERGRENAADGEVVFDSAGGPKLRVNPSVREPSLLGFGVWQGQGPEGYEILVDNVSFTSGSPAAADAGGDPEPPAEPE
ncbi:hypothetical protein [Phycisphaera mikurensis]|uniref:3-keto-disaccharide hydrolase domain-containing protein n=1 Tax=Phycisphaera mikurensis (strain NBRC 102666 / KCTC 22515 / FYK2301M01) TaxID=1142394 RepID=I0IEV5_PHYMF|nr:hypothetical protein [Phycisphaera mikurensis]MBB6441588.1 hypothetical protein [Phycisphaera mikurensis]BAM03793.1 hypothetical protein PSMK_16340 [Phycisphaera mikurensis NBRC 102666]